MEKNRGHETIEHGADMGIRGWGSETREAFEEIARAMFELIVDGEGIEPEKRFDVRAEGETEEELLVDFLNGLLTRADIEEMVFLDVDIDMLEETEGTGTWHIEAVAGGVPMAGVGERLLREVKAATYYGLSVKREDSGNTTVTAVVDL